jgi:hypothetical protein
VRIGVSFEGWVLMSGLGRSRAAAVLLAGALIATMATGITYAATSGGGAKACESTKGALALLSKKEKCPAHDRKVTLGATGPRGLRGRQGVRGIQGVKGDTGQQGPGALLTETDSTNTTINSAGTPITVPGTGITVTATCAPTHATYVSIEQNSTAVFFTGIAETTTGAGGTLSDNASPTAQSISDGTSLLNGDPSGTGNDQITLAINEPGTMYFNLLVNVGSTNTAPNPSFTIDGSLRGSALRCQADAQVTPATAPTT